MTRKLQTIKGRCVYEKRKQIVEPVFGQIKEIRRSRCFSFRGLKNVAAEWDLICLTHNLLKLYRSGWQLIQAKAAENWSPGLCLALNLKLPHD
jgi:hypothetical protein